MQKFITLSNKIRNYTLYISKVGGVILLITGILIITNKLQSLGFYILEIFPSHYEDRSWKISMFGDDIESIIEVDPLTGEKISKMEQVRIFANSHYVTPKPTIKKSIEQIKRD